MIDKKKSVVNDEIQRFGFRKFSFGLAGALLTGMLALGNPLTTQTAKADTVPDDPDQVNVQPSGEKAAEQELSTVQAPKAATASANTNTAPATKAAPAPQQTAQRTEYNYTSGQTNANANTGVTNQQTGDTQAQAQTQTPVQQSQQQAPKASLGTYSTPNITGAKKKAAKKAKKLPKANITKGVSKKLTRSGVAGVNSGIDTRSVDTRDSGEATDAAHTKYVNRTVTWYTVDSATGEKQKLTSIIQQVKFGQQWTDYNDGNGKIYTPWEQDGRKISFDPYTNQDLLTNAKTSMSAEDYQSLADTFKNAKSISSDGAPKSDPIGPLSQDLSYDILLTYEPKISAVKVSVVYQDLDDNKKVLDTKDYTSEPGGKVDATGDYKSVIDGLIAKGYTHDAKDDTLPNGGAISIPGVGDLNGKTSFVYYVGLHHKIVPYGPGENNPFTNKNDDANLVKNVTQTIQYKGANKTIPDNVQTIKFSRTAETDMVTGKTTYKDWDKTSDKYTDVTSPTVDGYLPDQTVVAGTQVTPTSPNTTKVVNYATADQMRDAIVHYRYDSWDSNKVAYKDKNRKIVAKDNGSGGLDFNKDDFKQDIIPTDGYTATVQHTNVQGGVIHAWIVYVKNPQNDFAVHFIDQDNNNQKIPGVNDVTANNVIGKPVEKPAGVDDIIKQLQDKGYEVVEDPFQNPPTAVDGKQDVNYVLKHKKVPVSPITNRTETVHFVDQDGKQIAPDKTQSASFTHNGITDLVTGETTWTDWSPNKTTDPVDVPVVNGYVTTEKQVPSQTLTPDKDIDITVKYNKIGKLVPVDDNGNKIPGANQPDYVNDPTDPTKVKPNQKVPDVPGYTPDVSTVTPTDPTKDTPVKYHKQNVPTPPQADTSLGIIVHDDDTNQDLPDYKWTSGSVRPGDKVAYDWNKVKQDLIDHGYVVVQEPSIPDNYGQSAQVITIHVKHGIVHVNPDKPQTPGANINKGNAKWPDTAQYQHDRKYTVHFVDKNGKQLAKDEVQTMRFGRDLQIDAVTGKILNPDAKWEPQNKQYAGVQADKINGYTVNPKSLAGVALVNGVLPGADAIDSDISDSIVYTADDKVPNDPGNGGGTPAKGTPQAATPAPEPAKPTPQAVAAKAPVQKASALPQTGGDVKQQAALSAIGVALVLLSLGAGPLRKRKH